MQKLKFILASNPALTNLGKSADTQQHIQAVWRQVVPEELAAYAEAGALQHKRLTIMVSNNAVAAKIKFLTPHLLQQLRQRQLEVSTLRTQLLLPTSARKAHPTRVLPNKAAEALQQFAEQHPSELAQNIKRLLRHAK
jgi:hypothetical protein